MLRSSRLNSLRVSASLLRSLALNGALAGGSLCVASMLVACADESKPEYWVEKLEDKQWQAKSIERLSQFYEDALSNNKKNMEAPEVKALLDQLAEPLTKVYVNDYSNLDEKTRESLINLLSSFRDPRTEPALSKAFEEFGKDGRGGKEVKWASRAVRDMKLEKAAPAVFAAFKKTKPSTKDGAYYRDLNEALLAIKSPTWSSELVSMLETEFPVTDPKKKPTVEELKDKRDLAYLVITACQVLGELGEAAAVKPLIQLVLDPTRAEAANEALLALTKIGKPSVEAAVKLLKDQDKELADYTQKRIQKALDSKAPPGGKPHVEKAAIILGAIGRTEGVAPILEAIESREDDSEKAGFLNALAQLPHTEQVKSAFFKNYEDLDDDAKAGNQAAIATLSEPATLFFDSEVTPVLVKRARGLKDDPVGKSLITLAAIKTMNDSQVSLVESLVKSVTSKDNPLSEKITESFESAAKVVKACKKDVACYLTEAGKTDNQGDKTQMAGIKAVYMVGQLGGPASGAKLVEIMPDLEKGALRYVAAQAIDHHNPKGSDELAKALDAIVEKNKESMDKNKAADDKPLRDAVYRLQARAM